MYVCKVVIEGDIQNHVHIDMSFGSRNEGSVKNWLVLAVCMLPLALKNELYDPDPNGPDTCCVGEFADATRFPVMPVMSAKKFP